MAKKENKLRPQILRPVPDFNIGFTADVTDSTARQILLAHHKEIEALGGAVEQAPSFPGNPETLRIRFNDTEHNSVFDPEQFSVFFKKLQELVHIEQITYVDFIIYEEMGKLRFTPRLPAGSVGEGAEGGVQVQISSNGEPTRMAYADFQDGSCASILAERNENSDPKRAYDVIGEIAWSKDRKGTPPLSQTTVENMMGNMNILRENLLTALNASQRLPASSEKKNYLG